MIFDLLYFLNFKDNVYNKKQTLRECFLKDSKITFLFPCVVTVRMGKDYAYMKLNK